ncbi:MAG: hypothetical protein H0V27_05640 [Pyrinomonadaceae bacterium]|nr:hypothetical protein [Pyrinomonadaceae bacterium]
MTNRRTTFLTLVAALFMLALPVIAAAQGGYGRDPYYRNDQRNDRRNDNYYRNNVRDAIRRVASRSGEFKDRLDDALDNSRYDGSRREDRLVGVADDFHDTAERLRGRYNNGRNNNNSEAEARRLFQLAARIDSFISRNNSFDSRVRSQWYSLRQDLNVIANAYNINGNYNNGDYRNNDDYNNRRNRRNNRRGSYNPYGY